MRYPTTFLWLKEGNPRLVKAQARLETSILEFGLNPLRFVVGPRFEFFGDVLRRAREACEGSAFVWCNSDVRLLHNPFDVPNPASVYGFARKEVPSGEIGCGVDMYYIPLPWWDTYLSRDVPKLYLGASYVDWWISRAMQKVGAYENLSGYIDHETHPKSDAAGSDKDRYYQHNFREYNSWAGRNECDPIPAPPYLLPKIGHVWGVRDAIGKMRRLKKRL